MSRFLAVAAGAAFLLLSTTTPASAQMGAPVQGLTVAGANGAIFAGWAGAAGDPYHEAEVSELGLGGFTLFGASAPGGPILGSVQLPWPPANPEHGAPAFLVPSVPDGTYWIVVVKGLTGTPNAPNSAWIQKVVSRNPVVCGAPPEAPTNLRQENTPVDPIVSIRWDLSPSGCPAETVRIEAGYTPGTSTAGVFDMLATPAWAGVAPPGTFYVRVRAGNRFGLSAPSNEAAVVVTSATCSGPGAPSGLAYTRVGNVVTLTWQAPANPGSLPIAYYRISGGTQSLVYPLGVNVPATPRSFSTTLAPGTYYAVVAAANGCGGSVQPTGVPSNEIMIVVP